MNSEQVFQLQHLYLKAADQLGYIRMWKKIMSETGVKDYILLEIQKHENEFSKINRRILMNTMPNGVTQLLN